ncbi:hypothetical protein [Zavarzinella formosa]|uniref:hypothetical protein n=1 Tax=Zavarzinella formosa TaxID=360055 RepID=UPI00031FA22C|nr:hypothetical protein [Zavarzinella formosa]
MTRHIDFETFRDILQAVIDLRNATEEMGKDIGKHFDGHPVCLLGGKQEEAIIRALELAATPSHELPAHPTIKWWLEWYHHRDGLSQAKVRFPDGQTHTIDTGQKLYDYIRDRL